MSDNSNEKKMAETGTVAVPPVKRKSIVPFAVAIVIVLLVIFAFMSFLNAQKTHRQIAELGRRITVLQESSERISGRVLAVEKELTRRALKQRRNRLTRSLRALRDLKPLLGGNPKLVAQVDGLVAALGNEKKQLELKLRGNRRNPAAGPSADATSEVTPCPCPQAGSEACPKREAAPRTECSNGVCRLVPAPAESGAFALVPAAPQQPAIAAGGGPGTGRAPVRKLKPDNWWTRFINQRIFGGD